MHYNTCAPICQAKILQTVIVKTKIIKYNKISVTFSAVFSSNIQKGGMPVDFKEIYESCEPKVYRFLLSLCHNADLAEELTEETFYQAFLHISKFEGRCEISTWLCQIAKNLYYKEMNRQKRFDNQQTYYDISDSDENLFNSLENRQKTIEIHKILKTMNNSYREVFTLHIFAELTFKEIAQIYDKSESWAKMTFYRAKAALINKLEEENEA